ncbi:MAG TPA: hypothetical protein VF135_08600, partial [Terriglobales bacterium]
MIEEQRFEGLENFLFPYKYSVDGGVVKIDVAARSLLDGVNLTGFKWTRIDVQAHGALVPLTWIEDGMHGFTRINSAGIRRTDFKQVRWLNFAGMARQVF